VAEVVCLSCWELTPGGTYTDAVLLDEERGVINTAKALTTKYDLSVGIQNAVEAALPKPPPDIRLVSLSSTLATNAIVEGKGNPVCLILIGYDPDMVAIAGLERVVDNESIVLIRGGHTATGEEDVALDIDAVRQAILTQAPHTAAFAISSLFAVRNPAHELQVKQLAHRLTGLPVTCGHELTTHLNAPRRALTVALNARLISLLQELILEVGEMLINMDINAPLMVVRGDGSLMGTKMALERPVETILSGPAASAVGASYLCNVGDAFVIDMGGTTTDIVALHNGRPRLNVAGAWVGNQRTMIEAVDAHTIGLGGDSEVHLADKVGGLRVGPRRVVPLSLLAEQYPAVLEVLRHQLEDKSVDLEPFVLCEQPEVIEQSGTTPTEQEILKLLGNGPILQSQLLDNTGDPFTYRRYLDNLMERSLVIASSFTPTDALHVLGQYRHGSVEAAEMGATLWARRLNIGVEEFCQRVIQQVILQMGQAVIASALVEEGNPALSDQDRVGNLLIERALRANDEGRFSVALSMRHPLIGIGAPAAAYLPLLATQLHTGIHIPEHAEVASAVGTVAGGIVQTVRILVRPVEGGRAYRVHLPFGVRNFSERLADAVAYAKNTACRLAREHAYQAGAGSVHVHTEQHDRAARASGKNAGKIHIETEVIATAVGRPRLKE